MITVQKLFAWGIAQVMRVYEPLIADRKRALFSSVTGHILEIGPGTGPNLKYLPKDVRWTGVESNPHMRRYLEGEAERLGLSVNLIDGSAQEIPLPDASVDMVIGTLVLCSVQNPQAVIAEVMRVLKPGGEYRFIEHVAATGRPSTKILQRVIKPVWHFCADGCNVDRRTWETLGASAFKSLDIKHFELAFPVVSPHIMGVAVR